MKRYLYSNCRRSYLLKKLFVVLVEAFCVVVSIQGVIDLISGKHFHLLYWAFVLLCFVGVFVIGDYGMRYVLKAVCVPILCDEFPAKTLRQHILSESFHSIPELKGDDLYNKVRVSEHWIWIDGYYFSRNGIVMYAITSNRHCCLHVLYGTGDVGKVKLRYSGDLEKLSNVISHYSNGILVHSFWFVQDELIKICKRYVRHYWNMHNCVVIKDLIESDYIQTHLIIELQRMVMDEDNSLIKIG